MQESFSLLSYLKLFLEYGQPMALSASLKWLPRFSTSQTDLQSACYRMYTIHSQSHNHLRSKKKKCLVLKRYTSSLDAIEQGWRSDESTRLPPMWPGFESRRRRHMWVECVVGFLPCSERFYSGYSGLESTDTFQRILKLLNVP